MRTLVAVVLGLILMVSATTSAQDNSDILIDLDRERSADRQIDVSGLTPLQRGSLTLFQQGVLGTGPACTAAEWSWCGEVDLLLPLTFNSDHEGPTDRRWPRQAIHLADRRSQALQRLSGGVGGHSIRPVHRGFGGELERAEILARCLGRSVRAVVIVSWISADVDLLGGLQRSEEDVSRCPWRGAMDPRVRHSAEGEVTLQARRRPEWRPSSGRPVDLFRCLGHLVCRTDLLALR